MNRTRDISIPSAEPQASAWADVRTASTIRRALQKVL